MTAPTPRLPPAIAAKVYQVLRTGAGAAPFKYEPENTPGMVYSVTVVPFQKQDATLPVSALLMIEDLTQREQLRQEKYVHVRLYQRKDLQIR